VNWFVRAFPFMTTVTPTSLMFSVVLGVLIGMIVAGVAFGVWWLCYGRNTEGQR
jgi:hypothetical protein